MRPHRRQPTRLPHPWDSPGKSTGVGCHFLLQYIKVKSESEVTQSCLTLRDPMDCSLPGSSAHGIFQARIQWSGNWTHESYIKSIFEKHYPKICNDINLIVASIKYQLKLLKLKLLNYQFKTKKSLGKITFKERKHRQLFCCGCGCSGVCCCESWIKPVCDSAFLSPHSLNLLFPWQPCDARRPPETWRPLWLQVEQQEPKGWCAGKSGTWTPF